MSREINIILILPKHVRIKDIDSGTIPIDNSWWAIVKEGQRVIERLPYGRAVEKYGHR
jgi:hypothetical protein